MKVKLKVKWEKLTDDDNNTFLEADSPYHDSGISFRWRLRKKLANDRIEWYADHDAELGGNDCGWWLDLADAKADIQRCHDGIMKADET